MLQAGDKVRLKDEEDCIVPPGDYTIAHVDESGAFSVGGRVLVWPRRVILLNGEPVSFNRY